jgi:hypothetical protein
MYFEAPVGIGEIYCSVLLEKEPKIAKPSNADF